MNVLLHLQCADRQIDFDLKLVTAFFAGPEVTDLVLAHVLGSVRRDEVIVTLVA
jgi:hypothetical protein